MKIESIPIQSMLLFLWLFQAVMNPLAGQTPELSITAGELVSSAIQNTNPITGIPPTRIGDRHALDQPNLSFTYALAITYLSLYACDRFSRQTGSDAQRIVDIFAIQPGIPNGLDASNLDVTESDKTSGPNAYMGICLLKQYEKTQEVSYLWAALEKAEFILEFQDKDGAIRRSKEESKFEYGVKSTEENLSVYGFFSLLNEIHLEEKYRIASDRIRDWLLHSGIYQKKNGENGGYFAAGTYRDKNGQMVVDKLYVTDVNALALIILKPDFLDDFPDKDDTADHVIDSFTRAQSNIHYVLPATGEKIEVEGFDFTDEEGRKNMPHRGHVISPEFSSQVALAYLMMAKEAQRQKKEESCKTYRDKAYGILQNLARMAERSNGAASLPYASKPGVKRFEFDPWDIPNVHTDMSSLWMVFPLLGFNPYVKKEMEFELRELLQGFWPLASNEVKIRRKAIPEKRRTELEVSKKKADSQLMTGYSAQVKWITNPLDFSDKSKKWHETHNYRKRKAEIRSSRCFAFQLDDSYNIVKQYSSLEEIKDDFPSFQEFGADSKFILPNGNRLLRYCEALEIVGENGTWIKTGKGKELILEWVSGHLFTLLHFSPIDYYCNQLNRNIVPEEMKGEFRREKCPLDQKPRVEVVEAHKKWILHQSDSRYVVMKEKNRLKVYLGFSESASIGKIQIAEKKGSQWHLSSIPFERENDRTSINDFPIPIERISLTQGALLGVQISVCEDKVIEISGKGIEYPVVVGSAFHEVLNTYQADEVPPWVSNRVIGLHRGNPIIFGSANAFRQQRLHIRFNAIKYEAGMIDGMVIKIPSNSPEKVKILLEETEIQEVERWIANEKKRLEFEISNEKDPSKKHEWLSEFLSTAEDGMLKREDCTFIHVHGLKNRLQKKEESREGTSEERYESILGYHGNGRIKRNQDGQTLFQVTDEKDNRLKRWEAYDLEGRLQFIFEHIDFVSGHSTLTEIAYSPNGQERHRNVYRWHGNHFPSGWDKERHPKGVLDFRLPIRTSERVLMSRSERLENEEGWVIEHKILIRDSRGNVITDGSDRLREDADPSLYAPCLRLDYHDSNGNLVAQIIDDQLQTFHPMSIFKITNPISLKRPYPGLSAIARIPWLEYVQEIRSRPRFFWPENLKFCNKVRMEGRGRYTLLMEDVFTKNVTEQTYLGDRLIELYDPQTQERTEYDNYFLPLRTKNARGVSLYTYRVFVKKIPGISEDWLAVVEIVDGKGNLSKVEYRLLDGRLIEEFHATPFQNQMLYKVSYQESGITRHTIENQRIGYRIKRYDKNRHTYVLQDGPVDLMWKICKGKDTWSFRKKGQWMTRTKWTAEDSIGTSELIQLDDSRYPTQDQTRKNPGQDYGNVVHVYKPTRHKSSFREILNDHRGILEFLQKMAYDFPDLLKIDVEDRPRGLHYEEYYRWHDKYGRKGMSFENGLIKIPIYEDGSEYATETYEFNRSGELVSRSVAHPPRQASSVFTNRMVEMYANRWKENLWANLALLGISQDTEIPRVEERHFMKIGSLDKLSALRFSSCAFQKAISYRLPGDPLGRCLMREMPNGDIVIDEWWKAPPYAIKSRIDAPAGVTPSVVVVLSEGNEVVTKRFESWDSHDKKKAINQISNEIEDPSVKKAMSFLEIVDDSPKVDSSVPKLFYRYDVGPGKGYQLVDLQGKIVLDASSSEIIFYDISNPYPRPVISRDKTTRNLMKTFWDIEHRLNEQNEMQEIQWVLEGSVCKRWIKDQLGRLVSEKVLGSREKWMSKIDYSGKNLVGKSELICLTPASPDLRNCRDGCVYIREREWEIVDPQGRTYFVENDSQGEKIYRKNIVCRYETRKGVIRLDQENLPKKLLKKINSDTSLKNLSLIKVDVQYLGGNRTEYYEMGDPYGRQRMVLQGTEIHIPTNWNPRQKYATTIEVYDKTGKEIYQKEVKGSTPIGKIKEIDQIESYYRKFGQDIWTNLGKVGITKNSKIVLMKETQKNQETEEPRAVSPRDSSVYLLPEDPLGRELIRIDTQEGDTHIIVNDYWSHPDRGIPIGIPHSVLMIVVPSQVRLLPVYCKLKEFDCTIYHSIEEIPFFTLPVRSPHETIQNQRERLQRKFRQFNKKLVSHKGSFFISCSSDEGIVQDQDERKYRVKKENLKLNIYHEESPKSIAISHLKSIGTNTDNKGFCAYKYSIIQDLGVPSYEYEVVDPYGKLLAKMYLQVLLRPFNGTLGERWIQRSKNREIELYEGGKPIARYNSDDKQVSTHREGVDYEIHPLSPNKVFPTKKVYDSAGTLIFTQKQDQISIDDWGEDKNAILLISILLFALLACPFFQKKISVLVRKDQ